MYATARRTKNKETPIKTILPLLQNTTTTTDACTTGARRCQRNKPQSAWRPLYEANAKERKECKAQREQTWAHTDQPPSSRFFLRGDRRTVFAGGCSIAAPPPSSLVRFLPAERAGPSSPSAPVGAADALRPSPDGARRPGAGFGGFIASVMAATAAAVPETLVPGDVCGRDSAA